MNLAWKNNAALESFRFSITFQFSPALLALTHISIVNILAYIAKFRECKDAWR